MPFKAFLDYDLTTDSERLMCKLESHEHAAEKCYVEPLVFTPYKINTGAKLKFMLADDYPAMKEAPFPYSVRGFLQAMMDVGWENGIRPTGQPDPTNELTAVRYHLEDMRRLVFDPHMKEFPPAAKGLGRSSGIKS